MFSILMSEAIDQVPESLMFKHQHASQRSRYIRIGSTDFRGTTVKGRPIVELL